jgi:hypothetical protein
MNMHNPPDCWCIRWGWIGAMERDFMRMYGRPIIKRPAWINEDAA